MNEEDKFFQISENNPELGTRRNSICMRISMKQYGEHCIAICHFQDLPVWFWQWLQANFQLVRHILFTNEAQITLDGLNNMHHSHLWSNENPHAHKESK